MNYSFVLVGLAGLFFLLLFAAIRIGCYWGRRHGPAESAAGNSGAAAIEASVFALLGLLVAFTFSGAAQRMAERRNLLVQEVNAMGTAWLRIDMINVADQLLLRDQFHRYVDERINYHQHVADLSTAQTVAQKVHPPVVTYLFLGFLALVCGCFVGLNLANVKRSSLMHQALYALVMTTALYIIVDFEFPRIGTIHIDQSDVLLIAQRNAMLEPAGEREP